MADPVLLPNGELHNFTMRIGGKFFRCLCGCNVFHKPDTNQLELYECNSCGNQFEAE